MFKLLLSLIVVALSNIAFAQEIYGVIENIEKGYAVTEAYFTPGSKGTIGDDPNRLDEIAEAKAYNKLKFSMLISCVINLKGNLDKNICITNIQRSS